MLPVEEESMIHSSSVEGGTLPHAGALHEEAPGLVRSRRWEGRAWPRAFIVTSMKEWVSLGRKLRQAQDDIV